MLQNAYFLAKIGADTAENEQHFSEILPTDAMEPGPPPPADPAAPAVRPTSPGDETRARDETRPALAAGDGRGTYVKIKYILFSFFLFEIK